jgi:hypothetical protein
VHGRFEAPSLPSVDVRLLLQPEHQRDAARYLRAATATLKTCGEWLGAVPDASLTLVDPAWRSGPAAPEGAVLMDRTPWWSARTSMAPELATSRAVSRRFWRERIDTTRLPRWFVEGLAEYVARRAVTPLFELENLSPGYAFLEERYFGGFIPRFVRVRLLAETDGDPVPAYRARPDASMAAQPGTVGQAQSLAGKTVLALGTLERWLGRPVFDQAIAEFVRESRSGRPTIADFARTATEVSGQNLSWLFDEAFGSSRAFDYGVGLLTSERERDGAFVTVVVARRFGDAQFTGASAGPIGPFESGRGITLRVRFEDGQQHTDYWDGRNREKTFRYRSPARAVSATVDPDRTLLLDLWQTNNSVTLAPRTGVAASRWTARWLAWLENALLNYSVFV